MVIASHGSTQIQAPIIEPSTLTNHLAPPWQLLTTSRQVLTLRDFQGKPTLLNFWATWCTPCKQEIPLLERYATAHRQVAVVGIDELEQGAIVMPFLRQLGVTYPVVLDGDGSVGRAYGVAGLPTTVVISSTGIVRAVHLGSLTERDLRVLTRLATKV